MVRTLFAGCELSKQGHPLRFLGRLRGGTTPFGPWLLAMALGLLMGLPATPSHAATFTVTTLTDAASGGSGGTGAGNVGDLRAQILAANASPGADVITFACASAPCTITLGGPLPPITDSLTIDGGSLGRIVIDGAGSYRVFFIDTGTVTLQKLTIQNAKAQGGQGGNGGGGGGGGAGLGAGVFVNQVGAAVTLNQMRFLNMAVVGGAGGSYSGLSWSAGGGAFDNVQGDVSTLFTFSPPAAGASLQAGGASLSATSCSTATTGPEAGSCSVTLKATAPGTYTVGGSLGGQPAGEPVQGQFVSVSGGVSSVPTLGEWACVALTLCLGLLGGVAARGPRWPGRRGTRAGNVR